MRPCSELLYTNSPKCMPSCARSSPAECMPSGVHTACSQQCHRAHAAWPVWKAQQADSCRNAVHTGRMSTGVWGPPSCMPCTWKTELIDLILGLSRACQCCGILSRIPRSCYTPRSNGTTAPPPGW